MNDVAIGNEQALQGELARARGKLEGLVVDLRRIDGELEQLAAERERYALLDGVCGGLEELSRLDSAELFWDGRASQEEGAGHVRTLRGRVHSFQKRIDEIEGRREEVLEEIGQAEDATAYIEDDLFELEREEEIRKLEWIPDREVESFPLRTSRMPWARSGEEDSRYRRALAASLLLSLLLGLVLPMIDLPMLEPWEEAEIPDRLTRLIAEERPLPPPPPQVQQETRPEEPESIEELVPEETESKAVAETTPDPAPASKGILAFREKFSSLAENDPTARLGAKARIDDSGKASIGITTRSMVTTQASGSSGGINLASLSRNVGSGGTGNLEGVAVARATSSIGTGGGSDRPLSGGPGSGRTDEEIQIVFDRHKSALYRLYNRELRRDPTLEGQMVLRIRIEPSGSVSLCELHSSDMDTPQLSAQVVGRVKTFDFGAKEVPPVTILYPIDFLPAT